MTESLADHTAGQEKPNGQDRASKLHKLRTTEKIKYTGGSPMATSKGGARILSAGLKHQSDLHVQLQLCQQDETAGQPRI